MTNALSGVELMKVSDIREDDAKGRHTTTHRELVLLPEGGCLIDTPGMRELQLWDQSDSLSASFQDIEELSAACRYRDCTHQKEPHCAVQQAITDGVLERSRLQSYFKLQRELAFIERKTNAQARLNEQRKSKQIAKGLKKGKNKIKLNISLSDFVVGGTKMTIQNINHLLFSVSNLEKSIAFYEKVFDAKLLVKGRSTAYLDVNGLWLALNVEQDIPRNDIHQSYTHIAFSIQEDDFDKMYEKLVHHNVNILEGRQRDVRDKNRFTSQIQTVINLNFIQELYRTDWITIRRKKCIWSF